MPNELIKFELLYNKRFIQVSLLHTLQILTVQTFYFSQGLVMVELLGLESRMVICQLHAVHTYQFQ